MSLIDDPSPAPGLSEKLERLWKTPIISNEAYLSGSRPHVRGNDSLGPFIRVATWNIEKSLHVTDVIRALTSEKAYIRMVDPRKAPPDSKVYQTMLRQRRSLLEADILVLQEMDIGVSRSGYIDAAAQLAKALRMNYAYGIQYLEIDPVLLGTHGTAERLGVSRNAIDSLRYRGGFGSAVLSRFPIVHCELAPLQHQPYDWHRAEGQTHGPVEAARRVGAKLAFHSVISRELKIGGRNYFRVDLHVPGSVKDTVSVINIHLEIKCQPKDRKAQLSEILEKIKEIDHTVIMAGDFNSAPSDISPTSLRREIWRAAINPTSWLSFAARLVSAFGTLFSQGRWVFNTGKNFHSPLAPDIPVLLPNKVRPMFDMIKRFRFDDERAFDFRGDYPRSFCGRRGELSNSNQRAVKGMVTTFSVPRPIGPIGLYRLDWIFVKSLLRHATDPDGPYRLAPHFGETLVAFNKCLKRPFSDHRPSIVDIPLVEPAIRSVEQSVPHTPGHAFHRN